MSQTAPHDGFNTGSDERLKLVRENNKLRKEVELFQKSEDSLTSQVRSLESKVDQLEEEKYKLLEEVSSIKCDLNIKDTENKRSKTKLDQIRSQCLALEERYLKQKEKLQKVMSSEKEFYKALQEVLDYYYESLLKYSQFSTKMLYKLMVNESINIQQELKEEFNTKMTGLKILKENIEIPSVKVNKNSLFRNLKQRVAFFQDINFDKTQLAFDKLLSELKNQGVKLEVGDMTLFVDGITASKIAKRGSIYDDTSVLNESYGTDPNMSQTMFLADLDKMDNTMNMSGTAKGGSFTSLSDHLNALKTQLSGKPEEGPDYQNMNKILQDMTNFVDFLHGNIDNGTKSVAQTPKAGHMSARGFSTAFGSEMDTILDDVDSRVDPQILKSLIVRIKGKMDRLKQNSSVRPQDLEQLDRLLSANTEANIDWNKLEVCQQRISKKITFMAAFIKDKQDILQEKRILLEKAEMNLKELQDSVEATVKELKGNTELRKRSKRSDIPSRMILAS